MFFSEIFQKKIWYNSQFLPKSDLRDDEEELEKLKRSQKSPIAAATAQKYAKEKGFKTYMECSAKNQKVIIR